MLQVAVSRPHRALKPRWNEHAYRSEPIRMYVEKSKNLRLGKSECMEHRALLKSRVLTKLNHHLHAERILTLLMSLREPKSLIQLSPHRSHRTISDHRQRRAHIHSWQKIGIRISLQIGSLIRKPNAHDRIIFDKRRSHRRSRPQLHQARSHQLLAHPLIELPQPEDQAVMLLHE